MKIAINGFGRIGRCFFKAAHAQGLFRKHELVAVNNLCDSKTAAHLLRFDSVHGRFEGKVSFTETAMGVVDGAEFRYLSEKDPFALPWKSLGVDLVVEASGAFTKRQDALKHVTAGAKRILLTAPGKEADATIVPGINDSALKKKNQVISMASCTTNCLAPMCKVLLDNGFGINKGFMTTVHAYTGDQRLLDTEHKDLRRARAAALNIIPTTTGAASSIGLVLPELAGKLDGLSIRVPTPDSSLVDLTLELARPSGAAEINAAFKKAASGSLKAILDYSEDPLVSSDITGNPASCVFDSLETRVLGGKGNFAKILGWYDNEWGYSNRLVDACKLVARL